MSTKIETAHTELQALAKLLEEKNEACIDSDHSLKYLEGHYAAYKVAFLGIRKILKGWPTVEVEK